MLEFGNSRSTQLHLIHQSGIIGLRIRRERNLLIVYDCEIYCFYFITNAGFFLYSY